MPTRQKTKDFKSDLAWVNKDLGDALLEKRNLDEAIACYIKAIQLQPDLFSVYNKLRAIYRYRSVELNQNQLDQLINCYQEAIKIKPEFTEHYLNLANILTQQGNIQEAGSYYQKVLSIKLRKTHPEFVKKYGDLMGSGQPNFIISFLYFLYLFAFSLSCHFLYIFTFFKISFYIFFFLHFGFFFFVYCCVFLYILMFFE